jgi:hypothetical protein
MTATAVWVSPGGHRAPARSPAAASGPYTVPARRLGKRAMDEDESEFLIRHNDRSLASGALVCVLRSTCTGWLTTHRASGETTSAKRSPLRTTSRRRSWPRTRQWPPIAGASRWGSAAATAPEQPPSRLASPERRGAWATCAAPRAGALRSASTGAVALGWFTFG